MKYALILILKAYKRFISPIFPMRCRFYPSCSDYAIQSIGCHGIIRGVYYAILRVLRCNPFSSGGYDPVVRMDKADDGNRDTGQNTMK
ncbi:membrane protein insertion efficiency factor YidD [Rickettsiales endosymbiont of Peranema trichophorum]|nr:membrane protein insertion efficiency factor YidD [Rickettsiales endosymbiont of Peranema trichophorum]